MGESGKRLLALNAEDRDDPRLLALFAQRDPILLGRILALANSAQFSGRGGPPITSLDKAIRLLGVNDTYTMMLGASLAYALTEHMGLKNVQKFLVQHTFTRWNTARSLCRYLSLEPGLAFVLQLGALIEPLGIYAALLYQGGISGQIKSAIENLINKKCQVASCGNCEFGGYAEISARIAEAWGTPERVIKAIVDPASEDGTLIKATDELIGAKIRGESQMVALVAILSTQSRWHNLNPALEIDLVSWA